MNPVVSHFNKCHMSNLIIDKNGNCYRIIFRKYITKNGKRIYPRKAKAFRLKVKKPKKPKILTN